MAEIVKQEKIADGTKAMVTVIRNKMFCQSNQLLKILAFYTLM